MRIFFTFVYIALCLPAVAQSIERSAVTAAGSELSAAGIQLSQSFGQPALVSEVVSGSFMLTQGFQQVYLSGLNTEESNPLPLRFSAFPNPSASVFTVQANGPAGGSIELRVINLQGLVVWQQTAALFQGEYQWQIVPGDWAPGIYILQLRHYAGSREYSYQASLVYTK